jgi:hypothetical protein
MKTDSLRNYAHVSPSRAAQHPKVMSPPEELQQLIPLLVAPTNHNHE